MFRHRLPVHTRMRKRTALNLPRMVDNNTSRYQTKFTVSIEAAVGVTTGVSALDRLQNDAFCYCR
jgi:3,4-dihydroxy-2-butanone 4-phosphate synthase